MTKPPRLAPGGFTDELACTEKDTTMCAWIDRLDSLEDRFWKRVEKTDDCWIWTGYTGSRSYGIIRIGSDRQMAHRFSYEMHIGEIPPGRLVMHSCDNPRCVNPAHLSLGTHATNHADKSTKGRVINGAMTGAIRRSPTSLNPRLSDEKRSKIRRLFCDEGMTQTAVATALGVSQNMVSRVLRDKGVIVPTMWQNMTAADRVAMIREYNEEKAA